MGNPLESFFDRKRQQAAEERLNKAKEMLRAALAAWDKAAADCGIRMMEPIPTKSNQYWQPENPYGMAKWWPWRAGEWPKPCFTSEEVAALKFALADTPVSEAWVADHPEAT